MRSSRTIEDVARRVEALGASVRIRARRRSFEVAVVRVPTVGVGASEDLEVAVETAIADYERRALSCSTH